MKGTLHKTGSGWQVWYHAKHELYHSSIRVKILPLLQEDAAGLFIQDTDSKYDGQEVEFEIIEFPSNSISKYAKLVDNPLTKNKTMQNEFITYEQALALKELGFDEPCMAIYYSKDKSFSWHHHKDHTNNEPALDSGEFNISAPTYSAAFRWFREVHGLNSYIYQRSNITYRGVIHKNMKIAVNYTSDSSNYEEAEQACLDELIKTVKNK